MLSKTLSLAAVALVAQATLRDPTLSLNSPWKVVMRTGFCGRRRLVRTVRFYPGGLARFSDDGECGEWTCVNDGIQWTTTRRADTVYYHANLCQDQFGSNPKMLCGVVTRDRRAPLPRALFRPVLGSFRATGNDRAAASNKKSTDDYYAW